MTISDVMICPKCKNNNAYEYSTDEIEFNWDGTGHYYVDCRCNECDNRFRLYMKFSYLTTESYTE